MSMSINVYIYSDEDESMCFVDFNSYDFRECIDIEEVMEALESQISREVKVNDGEYLGFCEFTLEEIANTIMNEIESGEYSL